MQLFFLGRVTLGQDCTDTYRSVNPLAPFVAIAIALFEPLLLIKQHRLQNFTCAFSLLMKIMPSF